MKLHRLFVMLAGCFALVAVTAVAPADEKAVDKNKIVGAWKLTKVEGKAVTDRIVLQFTKDDKLKITSPHVIKEVDKDEKAKTTIKEETKEGTYKVEGNKLSIVQKIRGEEDKATMTINELTDQKMLLTNKEGRDAEFEKTK